MPSEYIIQSQIHPLVSHKINLGSIIIPNATKWLTQWECRTVLTRGMFNYDKHGKSNLSFQNFNWLIQIIPPPFYCQRYRVGAERNIRKLMKWTTCIWNEWCISLEEIGKTLLSSLSHSYEDWLHNHFLGSPSVQVHYYYLYLLYLQSLWNGHD